jgi:hypothetical protein
MEDYSDLKFDGDLSFLNENLDAAKSALISEKPEEVKKETNSFADQQSTPTQLITPIQQKPAEKMDNYNDQTHTQNSNSNQRTESNSNQRMTNHNAPQFGEKKSQLEEMVLNSGYGPEMFNNLKMELLEMEKEKIIMKYKQDLMMMIIKS